MSLGREIQDFLGAFGKMDEFATNASKRDYYSRKGGGAYDPNNPPPGWGGVGTAKAGLGRRITNGLGITEAGGPSVGQKIGGAVGIGGGTFAGGAPPPGTSMSMQGGYDPDDYQQTYEEGGLVEPPLVIPPLPEPMPDPRVELPAYESYPGAAAAGAPVDLNAPVRQRAPMSAAPARPAVGGAQPAPAGRMALSDQRRTAAYDPELDGPTAALPGESYGPPASAAGPAVGGAAARPAYSPTAGGEGTSPNAKYDLDAAIDGGLRFAQKTFHLDGSNVGVGSDPNREGGARALMQGVGAAPAQLVQALDQKVNQGLPPGMNNEQLATIRRIEAVYTWRQANGDKAGADKAAFELMQYTAGVAAKLGTQAVEQYRAGDVPGAQQTVIAAYNQIPDGRHLTVQGNTATVVDTRTGKPVQSFQFTPDQILNAALGLSNRSLYWQTLAQRVASGGKASNRAESQQDLDRARADYYRARTGQVGKGKAGGGGRGGSADPGPAQSAIEKLATVPRPGGQPAQAPPQIPQDNTPPQGGGEPPDNADDDEERVLNADPAIKRSQEPTAPASVLRVKPPQPGSGSNPPPIPADGGSAVPAPRSAAGGRQTAFDPEGDGYDYESARAAGLKPDETGHWPTREPKSGMILKGRKHPTIALSEEADKKLGYETRKREDGRYESQPVKGGPSSGKPGPIVGGSSDPDTVPPQVLARNGDRYEPIGGRGAPKPFDETAPTGVPKELLDAQAEAVKLTAKQNGPAVRQHIAQRIKEWNDYNKGYTTRQKDHQRNELKRVDQEYKDLTTKQKAEARAAYDLQLKPLERAKLSEAVNAAWDASVEQAKTPLATLPEQEKAAHIEAFGKSIYVDPKVDPTRMKSLASNIMTSNPNPDPATAVRMVYDLTRVDPQDATQRRYRPVGKDVLGNVVLSTQFGPVHVRPEAFMELTSIIKDRLARAATAGKEGALKAVTDAEGPTSGKIVDKVTTAVSNRAKNIVERATTVKKPEGKTLVDDIKQFIPEGGDGSRLEEIARRNRMPYSGVPPSGGR